MPHQPRPVIYVAGPYSNPDPVENTHRAIAWGDLLWKLGAAPLVPHLTLLWHLASPKPYEEWLELDLNHLRGCDALLRIPGESSGADGEVQEAWRLGLPVALVQLRHTRPDREASLHAWLSRWIGILPR